MSYTSIGTNSYPYYRQDVTSARRTFRSVERLVVQLLDAGGDHCKVVMPFYSTGRPLPDGTFKPLSEITDEHGYLASATDNLIGTIHGLYIQGYSFPARYLVERGNSFITDLRDCSTTASTELFVDLRGELKNLSDLVQSARNHRYEIQPMEFRIKLYQYFNNLLADLAKISKSFKVYEEDMNRPRSASIYVHGFVAVATEQLNRLESTSERTLRVANEVDWFVSKNHERGSLRTEKQLGGDVRIEMEEVAVERIKSQPQDTLSHREAARQIAAEYDGRPGAYPNNESGQNALRKRIDRELGRQGIR